MHVLILGAFWSCNRLALEMAVRAITEQPGRSEWPLGPASEPQERSKLPREPASAWQGCSKWLLELLEFASRSHRAHRGTRNGCWSLLRSRHAWALEFTVRDFLGAAMVLEIPAHAYLGAREAIKLTALHSAAQALYFGAQALRSVAQVRLRRRCTLLQTRCIILDGRCVLRHRLSFSTKALCFAALALPSAAWTLRPMRHSAARSDATQPSNSFSK